MDPVTTMQSGSLAIDVRGLTKRFGDHVVVDGFDLQVRRGRIFGFLGPNGSGKTTTIRLLCGLLTPDGGSGTCLGFDIRGDSALIKRQVGYMTQKFGLYEDLSIEENLDFIGRIFELPERRLRVSEALDRLGLTTRRRQLAGALSGGWKQRLALAACLLHKPQLLLLDEPTAGVDPKARREFWDEIHDLASAGMTVLVSTHYMDEAERCHELAYISYGRLLARGSADQIIAGAALLTWAVTGPDLVAAGNRLRAQPGILTVASFGTALHVCAADQAAFERAAAAVLSGHHAWSRIDATLEDVFIALMRDAQDNYATDAA